VAEADAAVGPLPQELWGLLLVTNGLSRDTFRVLPVESSRDIKRTWDSIQRANDPKRTRFFEWDRSLLGRFLVSAEIGGGQCAAFERASNAIWYEDDQGFNETTLDLTGFIELGLREACT
jgi:hypothetical protein